MLWQRGVSLCAPLVATPCALQSAGQVVISSHEHQATCRKKSHFIYNHQVPLYPASQLIMLTDLSTAMLGSALSIWNKGARLTGSGLSALPDLLSCAYMPVASTVLRQDAHRVPLQERMWHFVLSRLLLNLPVILKTISPGRGHHLHKHHSSYSTTASWVCMLSHHANAMKLPMLEQHSHTQSNDLCYSIHCVSVIWGCFMVSEK